MQLKVQPGAHIKKKHLHELERIVTRGSGITARSLLNYARKKSSPLHDFFEWNDSIAAEKFRLSQAGHLLRKVVIEVEINNRPTLIRAFHPIEVIEGRPKVYYPLNEILSDKEKRKQVVEYALNEMEGWTERYFNYKELRPIHRVYRKVVKKLKIKRKKSKK